MVCEGDRNTNFFHSLLKLREGRWSLSSMHIGDDIIYDPDGIGEHVSYYQHLFSDWVMVVCTFRLFGSMFRVWSLQMRMLSSFVFLLMIEVRDYF